MRDRGAQVESQKAKSVICVCVPKTKKRSPGFSLISTDALFAR